MCGINGIVSMNEAAVAAMNAATRHRGPDQDGVSAARGATIGNNRLAIIDISEAGRQPITSADGRFTIVFNGEIYNYREIRAELVSEGVRFRGNSDTEVLVEGYAKWGSAVTERLRGMWAIAIRDERSGDLFLSRDPFGIKPLYLYSDGRTTAFSSEIKGLLALPQVSREISYDAVRDVLLLGYVLAPRTILKHARAFLPGEEATIGSDGKVRGSKVRRLAFDTGAASAPPEDRALEDALEDSVKHHLIADVPVGLFFSGGVDSTVLAVMLQKVGARLSAYHVSVEGKSDTAYASAIAARLGLDYVEVGFGTKDVAAVAESYWKGMDQPFADSSLLPTMIVSRRAVQDVKVALSGEGGDELFGGYARHRRMSGLSADFARSRKGVFVADATEVLLSLLPSSIGLLPKSRGAMRREAALAADPIGLYIAETAIGVGVIPTSAAREAIGRRLAGRETPDGQLALDRLVYLPDDLLSKIDVATMSTSLEGRVPFLDREVFSLVAAAPLSWKADATGGKAPLRRILKRALPPDLVDRPKTGFSLPLQSYLLEHHKRDLAEAADWYRDAFPGAAPALDSLLRWGTASESRLARLGESLGYTMFALLCLHKFVKNKL